MTVTFSGDRRDTFQTSSAKTPKKKKKHTFPATIDTRQAQWRGYWSVDDSEVMRGNVRYSTESGLDLGRRVLVCLVFGLTVGSEML